MQLFTAAYGVVACATKIPVVLFENSTYLVILTLIGLFLVYFRYVIIAFSPVIGDNANFWTDLLDITLDYLEAMVVAIRLAVEIIIAAVDVLRGKSVHIDKPKFHLYALNASEVAAVTHEISYSCKDYDTLSMILLSGLKYVASPAVCPLIRYTFPLQNVFHAASTGAGWLSYDAAPWPFGGVNVEEPGNCEGSSVEYNVLCISLGAG